MARRAGQSRLPHGGTSVRIRAIVARLGLVAVTVAALRALWWLTDDLVKAAGQAGTTFDEAVGLAALTGCWLCLGWFGLAVTCALATAVPGAVGRTASSLADVVTPSVLRTVLVAGLGLTVVTGPAALATSASSPGTTSPAATTWAGDDAAVRRAALPQLDRPAEDRPVVTVQAGDCLWTIAARALGPEATDAQIAAAWPSWYAANRAVIGADPNLLQPGQRLVAPV